jgi:hypothetical protein
MYLQKVISKINFFVDILKVTDEDIRIRIRIPDPLVSGYRSADSDLY